MKTLYVCLLIVCSATLFSCKKDLVGSGQVITQQRQTTAFSAVTSKGDFKVILKKAALNSLQLSGEDNVLEKVITEVSGGTLTIRFDNSVKTYRTKQVVITVNMPAVSRVQLEGSGSIESPENWSSPNLAAIMNGSGRIDLSAQGDSFQGEINGSGKMKLNGTYGASSFYVNGSGSMTDYTSTSTNADVNIQGSGKCEIKVTGKLKVKINGSGKVYYKGNPNTNITVVGSGSAIKVN